MCCGSPEQEADCDLSETVLRRDGPFWCHEGQAEVDGRHVYTLMLPGGVPIGAQICAGWFDWFTTGRLPNRPYQDLEHVRPRSTQRRSTRFDEVEAAVLAELHGGCSVPVSAYARAHAEELVLTAQVTSLDGRQVVRDTVTGADPEEMGRRLAERLRSGGGTSDPGRDPDPGGCNRLTGVT